MNYALITGGSSGIGLAFAKQLALRSYNLILVSNREEENVKVSQELFLDFQVDIRYFTIDLAHPQAAQQTFIFCQNNNLYVEVLINNAGFFFFDTITNDNLARTDAMVQLHITTPTLLCALFGREMKKRKKGYILNVSSVTSWTPYPCIAVYAASKRYIKNFSRSIAYELNDFGVKVSAVCPSAVDTNLYNLSPFFRKRLLRWNIMYSPETLAKKSIKALFKGKVIYIPGFLNRLIIIVVSILPPPLINFIKRKAKLKPLMN